MLQDFGEDMHNIMKVIKWAKKIKNEKKAALVFPTL